MESQLFVRPVTLVGVGSAMLHHRFISRASDFMNNPHAKHLRHLMKSCEWSLFEALEYLWSNPDKIERAECFFELSKSPLLLKKMQDEVVGFIFKKPAIKKPCSVSTKPTFLYLMAHARNGCFKIGMSRTPHAREGTLQAEDPELKMVGFWKATVEMEREAHKMFASKRVRGEWFRLDSDDLEKFAGFVNPVIQSKNSGRAARSKETPPALTEGEKKSLRSPDTLLKALVAGMRVEAK